MKAKEKNINDCLKELNLWLRSRPYWENTLKFERVSYDFFVCRVESKTDIHFYPHYVIKALEIEDNKIPLILEHITPILIRHNINTISLGNRKYKFFYGKYMEYKQYL